MDPITRQAIAAAGGAGGAGLLYVDDVFSTFLYEGTNSTNSINNGIDLSGEGGLVWIKGRDNSEFHRLFDTARGDNKQLSTNSNTGQGNQNHFSSFNSNGFTVTTNDNSVNNSSYDYVSWSFRKAPGFFDVVAYTGDGTTPRAISHNLGSTPGMIIIKKLDATSNWVCYHRSIGAQNILYLNETNAQIDADWAFADTAPTSTHFTVHSDGWVNSNGDPYIAYLFAHDDQSFGTDSDEAIIKCGNYSGTGSSGNFVNVGFEPQFILIKNTSAGTNWMLLDVMRGLPAQSGSTAKALYTNTNSGENANNSIEPSATGFTPTGSGSYTNQSGNTYIYMAIRRPHKPPTAGTEVFAVDTKTAASANTPQYTSGFPVDLAFRRNNITSSDNPEFIARLTNGVMYTNLTNAEVSGGTTFLDYFAYNNGWANATNADSNDYLWMFRRAPGFFDVVAYTGNGSAGRTENHNLTVVPEMMIIKKRNGTGNWQVYHSSQGNGKYSPSFRTDPFYTSSARWNDTTPTSTQFTLGSDNDVNGSSLTYIAYLFATLDGISKVGSYSGSGYAQNIDCGFTNGARFVMIKRADTEIQGSHPSRTNWYVWDSTRGISSGNDPWIALNEQDAQVTNTDYLDPLNAGFTVSSTGSGLNASGGTYLFLAIA